MANGLNLDPEVLDSVLRKKGLSLGSTEGIDLSDRALREPEKAPEPEEKNLNFIQYWFEHRSPKAARDRKSRAKTKRADRQAQITDLNKRFKFATDTAQLASKLKGKERESFYSNSLPEIEKVFPGASSTIKALAKDPEALKKLIDDFAQNPSKQNLHDAAFQVDRTGKTNVELMKLDVRRAAKKKPKPFTDVPGRIQKQADELAKRIGFAEGGGLSEQGIAFSDELTRRASGKMRDPDNPLAPNEAFNEAFKEIQESGRLKKGESTDPLSIFGVNVPLTGGEGEVSFIPELDLGETPAARGKKEVIEQSALPKGIPKGSVLIGTSDGKPVYETKDGKRLIVK